jgi:hypothetical protein
MRKIRMLLSKNQIYLAIWFFFINPSDLVSMSAYANQALPRGTKSLSSFARQEFMKAKIKYHANEKMGISPSKECYNLMMLIDDIEKVNSKKQAISCDLVAGLLEKNFPIMVSRSVVYNVCMQYQSYSPTNYLFRHTKMRRAAIPLLYSINLSDNDWYCYDHSTSEIMLFVPKTYVQEFSNDENHTKQMQECGFDTAQLKNLTHFNPATLVKYIEEKNKNSTVNSTPIVQAIESTFTIPHGSPSPIWIIYLSGHGLTKYSIAGFSTENFLKLLACFQKINCSYLHYCSCYSGGLNQVAVKDELLKLNVNFIVSTQGINEEFTYGVGKTSLGTGSTFTHFFKKGKNVFGDMNAQQEKHDYKGLQKDPIAAMVNTVISKELDFSQPFIYFPAAGVFNALAIDTSIKIITKNLVKAYEFENESIDFTDPTIKTLIIYPNYIGIPLRIKAHTAIVSPTQSADIDIHIFEKITYEDKLSSVIPNFISFNAKTGVTVFVIKELQCGNYIESTLSADDRNPLRIENMLIVIQTNLTTPVGNREEISKTFFVEALFSFNEKIYRLSNSLSVSPTQESSKMIFDSYEEKPATGYVLTEFDFTHGIVLRNLRSYLTKKKLYPTEITLSTIVNALEESIDKTSSVQKLGSLKEVLELKRSTIFPQPPLQSEQSPNRLSSIQLKQPTNPLPYYSQAWQSIMEYIKKGRNYLFQPKLRTKQR